MTQSVTVIFLQFQGTLQSPVLLLMLMTIVDRTTTTEAWKLSAGLINYNLWLILPTFSFFFFSFYHKAPTYFLNAVNSFLCFFFLCILAISKTIAIYYCRGRIIVRHISLNAAHTLYFSTLITWPLTGGYVFLRLTAWWPTAVSVSESAFCNRLDRNLVPRSVL